MITEAALGIAMARTLKWDTGTVGANERDALWKGVDASCRLKSQPVVFVTFSCQPVLVKEAMEESALQKSSWERTREDLFIR